MYRIHYDSGRQRLDIRYILDTHALKRGIVDINMFLIHQLQSIVVEQDASCSFSLELYGLCELWFKSQNEPVDTTCCFEQLMLDYDNHEVGGSIFFHRDHIIVWASPNLTIGDDLLPFVNRYVILRFSMNLMKFIQETYRKEIVGHDIHIEGTF